MHTASNELNRLKRHLTTGAVYRRRDLLHLSPSLDRHLKKLVAEGTLKKIQQGMYLCPENSAFGEVPASEDKLLSTFLRSDKFLAYSPNTFNRLGLGSTQLYNTRTVLNQKRHGRHVLGGRNYYFHRRANIPAELTKEVLLVELLNNLTRVAEDPEKLLNSLKSKLPSFDYQALMNTAERFGNYSTQLKLRELSKESNLAA